MPPCTAVQLQGWFDAAHARIPGIVGSLLAEEVDAEQAAMFARRLQAVDLLLQRIEAQGLRVALTCRTVELLRAPAPRALRIRALADFYYSQAARIHHQQRQPSRSIDALVDGLRWTPIDGGLDHGHLAGPGPAGPVHIHLLRGPPTHLRCLRLIDPHASLPGLVRSEGAVAGVSGGFFLYSEPHIPAPLHRRQPVGLLLSDGQVVSGPDFRRATLWVDETGLHMARGGPVGWTLQVGRHRVPIAACNDEGAHGPTWFNAAWGGRAPRTGLQIRGLHARGRGSLLDPLGGVLVGAGLPDHHGPVQWHAPGPWTQAMAGGPMLLDTGPCLDLRHEDFSADAPPITFSRDETYDENLLPRMAAGIDSEGRAVFAAIDGRNFDHAPGFTLRMTAQLMHAVGCVQAMNLDGGSSKRMAVGDRCVDLASTEVVSAGERPARVRRVVSAILLGTRSR